MNFKEREVFERMAIREAFNKAEEVLRRDEISLDRFDGGEVERDKEYVEKMEGIFKEGRTTEEEEGRMLAVIFEAIMHEQSELSDWLGPDATTIKPSRYDDIANGVDQLVEFLNEEEASYLAMAVDVTFGEDVVKKFDRIKNEIDSGVLGRVKYFYSENTKKKGFLENVPRVVIGADARTVKELSELWVEGRKKELSQHNIQYQILDEILIQAETFAAYAEKNGKVRVAGAYKDMAKKIGDIIGEKELSSESRDLGGRDDRFYDIKVMLKKFE